MLKNNIVNGQTYVMTEEALAKKIIIADIENDEEKKLDMHNLFSTMTEMTDELARTIFQAGFSADEVYDMQQEMIREGRMKRTGFGTQMLARTGIKESHLKLYAMILGEYHIILYQLMIELLRKEEIPEIQIDSLIESLAKSCVNVTMASRYLLKGDLETAKTLSTPELVASKEEIIEALEQFTNEWREKINNRMENNIMLEGIYAPKYVALKYFPNKIDIAALNILRMQYGLEPIEPYRTDNKNVVEAHEWAKEKAKEYFDVKKEVLKTK